MISTVRYQARPIANFRDGEFALRVGEFDGFAIKAKQDPNMSELEFVVVNPDNHSAVVWALRRPRAMAALGVGTSWLIDVDPLHWIESDATLFTPGMIGLCEHRFVLSAVSKHTQDPLYMDLNNGEITGNCPDCTFVTRKWTVGILRGFEQHTRIHELFTFECEAQP